MNFPHASNRAMRSFAAGIMGKLGGLRSNAKLTKEQLSERGKWLQAQRRFFRIPEEKRVSPLPSAQIGGRASGKVRAGLAFQRKISVLVQEMLNLPDDAH